MSGDLISLRVLLVSADRPTSDLWRQSAALASVPIEFVECDGGEAPSVFERAPIDIVLIDSQIAGDQREVICKCAHEQKPAAFTAIFDAGAAKPVYVDATLPKPADLEEGRGLIERCVKTRFPTRVLIVDDSATMRNIVRKILSASRHLLEVSEAAEGIAALNAVSSGKADIVLLDYNMPGFTGIETLAEIKRVAPKVAVVMMTSTLDDALVHRAQTQGALAFLKKPFYLADIETVLRKYFGFD
ncbi:MAG: response regulator [Pseudolabrys sp.]|nr:response regulator [Pseudolabrys sp.]